MVARLALIGEHRPEGFPPQFAPIEGAQSHRLVIGEAGIIDGRGPCLADPDVLGRPARAAPALMLNSTLSA